MLWAGVIFGLVAAVVQSVAYVFSRQYIVARPGGAMRLLVISHVVLGIMSLPVVPIVWSPEMADVGVYWWDLLGASGFYLIGQATLFLSLRNTDASRVAPLLGLKVMFVALLYVTLMDAEIGPMQWLAVGLSVVAAFVLNYTGGSMPPVVIAGTLFTCLTYGLSDLHIIRLVPLLGDPGTFVASARATALSYALCGVMCLPLLWWYGSRRLSEWTATTNYAVTWMGSMYALFASLAMAGPVLANIVIATRGLWSIAIGFVLAAMGFVHLERKVHGHVALRRAAAAVLMIVAIGLYWANR